MDSKIGIMIWRQVCGHILWSGQSGEEVVRELWTPSLSPSD